MEYAGLPVADPAHGDLHIVIPDSLPVAAFRGPVAVPLNGVPGAVEMAATLRRLGPAAVMQLNEARYGAAAFEAAGIRHFALEFPDCTAPPDHIVKAFLAAVDIAAAAAVGSG